MGYNNPQYNPDTDDYDYATCDHGVYKGYLGGYCKECDAYEDKRGGLDKCLNCGKYKYGDQLDKNQVCILRCRNPNEY